MWDRRAKPRHLKLSLPSDSRYVWERALEISCTPSSPQTLSIGCSWWGKTKWADKYMQCTFRFHKRGAIPWVAEQPSVSISFSQSGLLDSITFNESYFGRYDVARVCRPSRSKTYFFSPSLYRTSFKGIFTGEERVRGVKLTTHFNLMSQIRKVELYLHYLVRLKTYFIIKHTFTFIL